MKGCQPRPYVSQGERAWLAVSKLSPLRTDTSLSTRPKLDSAHTSQCDIQLLTINNYCHRHVTNWIWNVLWCSCAKQHSVQSSGCNEEVAWWRGHRAPEDKHFKRILGPQIISCCLLSGHHKMNKPLSPHAPPWYAVPPLAQCYRMRWPWDNALKSFSKINLSSLFPGIL